MTLNNPLHFRKDKGKPQKVVFVCDCDTLKAALDLRAEINFRAREMGYMKNKDFKCEIKKDETNHY